MCRSRWLIGATRRSIGVGSVLMELELIEPSLYFNSSEGSAARAASGWQQFLASTAEVLPVASSVAPPVA